MYPDKTNAIVLRSSNFNTKRFTNKLYNSFETFFYNCTSNYQRVKTNKKQKLLNIWLGSIYIQVDEHHICILLFLHFCNIRKICHMLLAWQVNLFGEFLFKPDIINISRWWVRLFYYSHVLKMPFINILRTTLPSTCWDSNNIDPHQ